MAINGCRSHSPPYRGIHKVADSQIASPLGQLRLCGAASLNSAHHPVSRSHFVRLPTQGACIAFPDNPTPPAHETTHTVSTTATSFKSTWMGNIQGKG